MHGWIRQRRQTALISRIGSRTFGDKISIRDSPGARPRSLRPAVAEAVERIREQWSLELVDYDHARNDDESKDNS
jgi:hypothetical protein